MYHYIRLVSHIALAQKEYHFDVLSWPERLKLGLMSNDDQKLNFDDQIDSFDINHCQQPPPHGLDNI
jgi:hypothetical protein